MKASDFVKALIGTKERQGDKNRKLTIDFEEGEDGIYQVSMKLEENGNPSKKVPTDIISKKSNPEIVDFLKQSVMKYGSEVGEERFGYSVGGGSIDFNADLWFRIGLDVLTMMRWVNELLDIKIKDEKSCGVWCWNAGNHTWYYLENDRIAEGCEEYTKLYLTTAMTCLIEGGLVKVLSSIYQGLHGEGAGAHKITNLRDNDAENLLEQLKCLKWKMLRIGCVENKAVAVIELLIDRILVWNAALATKERLIQPLAEASKKGESGWEYEVAGGAAAFFPGGTEAGLNSDEPENQQLNLGGSNFAD